jgi:hypothetical protein
MKRKIWILPLILSVLVATIAVAFHYTVHIENALTLQPEPGFGVETNGWRTVFEPVLGVLLYFNRTFYGVKELTILLYWLIVLFVVYTLTKGYQLKDKIRKNFLLGQLVNLPILVGVWFAFFVLIIFIPLPNDRIVNNTPDLVLVTTHTHTEYSHDGLMSQKCLLKWHQRNGFDAFFITEHNNHNRTLEFVNTRLTRNITGEPVVFCGEEFSGSNHLSLLGLKTDFRTKGLSDSAVVAKARADGAAIIVNHWFSGEHKTPEFYRDLGADGFEIENTGEDKRYNREVYQRIKTLCENSGLIMIGGLDFHGYGSACTLWNAFEVPGWKSMDYRAKEESLLNIIKTRDQSKLKVLLLNDRPYYDNKNLIFSPIITIFNYFRTLNFLQVVSWIGWIFLFVFIYFKINETPAIAQKITFRKLFPVAGIFGAYFLIGLGLVFVFRNQDVEGFTEIYPEYYRLLFMAGSALLVVSGLTAYFRVFRKTEKQ